MSGQLRYTVEVFNLSSGFATTQNGVAFTLKTSQLADAPVMGGQFVRVAEGKVESQPWKLRVLDVNSTFTAHLASSGRLNLLGRVVRIRSSLNSTAAMTSANNLFVGRLTDVNLNKDVVSWDLTLQDELALARQLQIFSQAKTCALLPKGLTSGFMHIGPQIPAGLRWTGLFNTANHNLVLISLAGFTPSWLGGALQTVAPSTDYRSIAQFIMDDLKPNAKTPTLSWSSASVSGSPGGIFGNFQTVRFRHTTGPNSTWAGDIEIAGFGVVNVAGGFAPNPNPIWDLEAGAITPSYMWLLWPTSVHAKPTVNVLGYVYAPSHLPTAALPLHIGGTTGKHPVTLMREIYQGKYNAPAPSGTTLLSSTKFSLRIGSTATYWQPLEAKTSFGRVWFRITSPVNMQTFIEQKLSAPFGLLPLINTNGQLIPVATLMSSGFSTRGSLTSTNLLGHPTWEHGSREVVTCLRYKFERYGVPLDAQGRRGFISQDGDGLFVYTKETTRYADTFSRFGRAEQTFAFGAVVGSGQQAPPVGINVNPTLDLSAGAAAERFADYHSKAIFTRFRDGPLYCAVACLRSVDPSTRTIQPGDIVKLNLGTWPNPLTNTRGGNRYLQVIQRAETPLGPTFRLLDLATTQSALAAPTVALSLTAGDTRHSITLTVASVPSGAQWVSQLAKTSTGATLPVTGSSLWFFGPANTTKTVVVAVGQRPSNSKFFARVRSLAPTRLISPWSTASVSVITAKITASTKITLVSKSASTALITWSKGSGSSIYPADIDLDNSTVAANLGTSRRIWTVPANTTRSALVGLTTNSKSIVGVQYRDPYGGKSTMQSLVISTTGQTKPTAPVPRILLPIKL